MMNRHSPRLRVTLSATGIIIIAITLFSLTLTAPDGAPKTVKFEVGEDESLRSVSSRLESQHLVRSALFFRAWISFLKRDTSLGLGVYNISTPITLGGIVHKFVKGPDEPLLSVTIPEGSTTKQAADLIKKALPTISADMFIALVEEKNLDGYLFPSTYYPLPSYTEEDMIRVMNNTFEREYGKHFSDAQFPAMLSTRDDVISLAAILEGEAKTPEDMKIVAGILEKRLAKGMRLQVDVAPETYKKDGLPARPIANPGLIAIDAALHPAGTSYLYYLTGKDGKMYYAKTYDEHKKNVAKYLK